MKKPQKVWTLLCAGLLALLPLTQLAVLADIPPMPPPPPPSDLPGPSEMMPVIMNSLGALMLIGTTGVAWFKMEKKKHLP